MSIFKMELCNASYQVPLLSTLNQRYKENKTLWTATAHQLSKGFSENKLMSTLNNSFTVE